MDSYSNRYFLHKESLTFGILSREMYLHVKLSFRKIFFKIPKKRNPGNLEWFKSRERKKWAISSVLVSIWWNVWLFLSFATFTYRDFYRKWNALKSDFMDFQINVWKVHFLKNSFWIANKYEMYFFVLNKYFNNKSSACIKMYYN